MPSLSLGELILILVVVVVFIRPEELPKVMRKLGRVYAHAQRSLTKFKDYSQDAMDELTTLDMKPASNESSNNRVGKSLTAVIGSYRELSGVREGEIWVLMDGTVLDDCLRVLRGQPSSERFAVLAGEVPMGPAQSGWPRSQIMRITRSEVYQAVENSLL